MGLVYWLNLEYSELDLEYEKLLISKVYGEISKKYLSQAYEIDQFSTVDFKLIEIREGDYFYSHNNEFIRILERLRNCDLKLVFVRMRTGNDRLYLRNETWSVFRDAGVLVDSSINIKIEEAISSGTRIKIFPLRDVS